MSKCRHCECVILGMFSGWLDPYFYEKKKLLGELIPVFNIPVTLDSIPLTHFTEN